MKKIAISGMLAVAVLTAGARAMFAQEALIDSDAAGDKHIQAWYTGGSTASCHDACTTNVCCIQ
jgi:hypothetical protein